MAHRYGPSLSPRVDARLAPIALDELWDAAPTEPALDLGSVRMVVGASHGRRTIAVADR
jgi:hypothetical protein